MVSKKILTTLLGVSLATISSTASFATESSYLCQSTSYNRYLCTEQWGYAGEDPYNVDRFSSVAPDGTKHGCTSFAAYMLAMFNVWMPSISTFDSAQYWDTDADTRTDAVLSTTPHVGDIAQWNASSGLTSGHVAYVKAVVRNAAGALQYIDIADDNGGLLITTQRRLYPGSTAGVIRWPDNFITFPSSTPSPGGGSGGGVIVVVPTSTTPETW